MRVGSDVGALDEEAQGEEKGDGNGVSHGVRSVCSRESVLWHAPRSVFCAHSVAFSELRLTRQENATNQKKLVGGQKSRILS